MYRQKTAQRELSIFSLLRHMNVTRFIGAFSDNSEVQGSTTLEIVMEALDTSLEDLIHPHRFSDSFFRDIQQESNLTSGSEESYSLARASPDLCLLFLLDIGTL